MPVKKFKRMFINSIDSNTQESQVFKWLYPFPYFISMRETVNHRILTLGKKCMYRVQQKVHVQGATKSACTGCNKKKYLYIIKVDGCDWDWVRQELDTPFHVVKVFGAVGFS
jgi:hypothetical protein